MWSKWAWVRMRAWMSSGERPSAFTAWTRDFHDEPTPASTTVSAPSASTRYQFVYASSTRWIPGATSRWNTRRGYPRAGASDVCVETLRVAEPTKLSQVAAEEEGHGPVDDDAGPALRQRELVQVVAPGHEPPGKATKADPEDVGDPLVAAERRDLAQHAVAVRLEVGLQVLREPPRLSKRVLAGRGIGRVRLRVGNAGAVAERPDVLRVADPEELVDLDAVPVVERESQVVQDRVRANARGPDERARRDAGPVAEDSLAVAHGLQDRPDVDLHAALGELARRVLAETARDLREDLRCRVDDHPALRHIPQARVIPHRVRYEVGELGERLDPRVAGADEEEREMHASNGIVRRRVGRLELAQHVVAQVDGIGQRLEREPVLGEPRHGHDTGDRPEGEHELPPGHNDLAFLGRDRRRLRLDVDGAEIAEQEVGVRAHDPERHDGVSRLERAGRRLRKHRRVEHEVLLADDRRATLAEKPRDVCAGEAAAENEHAALRVTYRHADLLPVSPGGSRARGLLGRARPRDGTRRRPRFCGR